MEVSTFIIVGVVFSIPTLCRGDFKYPITCVETICNILELHGDMPFIIISLGVDDFDLSRNF